MTFEEICDIFGASGSGDRRKCRCPAHKDEKASLCISKGNNGKTLIYCHAGCSTNQVLESKGLEFCDLNDESLQSTGERWKSYVENEMSRKTGKQLKIEGIYNFHDLSGKYAYTKVRMTGKEMVLGRLKNGRFNLGLGGKKRKEWTAIFTNSVSDLKKAAECGGRIFYAEGEKDVLTLQQHGYLAVTAGGSSDWQTEFSELFSGADVVICADNDLPGLKLVKSIKDDLRKVAAKVTVVNPMPEMRKGDITDFYDAGGTDTKLQRMIASGGITDEQIEDLITQYEAEKKHEADTTENVPEAVTVLPKATECINLDRFHKTGKNGQISDVYDWEIYCYLISREHILIMGGIPYIYKDGIYKADSSGTKLKTMIRELIYPEFRKATILKRVYDLFLTSNEIQAGFGDLNDYPESWICFRNGMYDPVERRMLPHDPKYRAINQIPHDFNPQAQLIGDSIDSWLRETFPQEDDREMLLEYIGLCMNRDTKQQKFLMLNGLGGTGKSGLIGLIVDIVGDENCSHVPLERLSERFTAIELMGKLLNSCADLKIAALDDVSVLKQVLGEDSLRGEAKGKDGINFRSYAKLLFSVNELPTVKGERTNGFYRRLLILSMNKIPERVNVNLFSNLHKELPYLIRLAVDALGRMYAAGVIAESNGSEEAVNQMINDSDSVQAWIDDTMYIVPGFNAKRPALFQLYFEYCNRQERQPLQKNNFYKALRSKGYSEVKVHGERYFTGLAASPNAPVRAP